jgi:hypothetical protein
MISLTHSFPSCKKSAVWRWHIELPDDWQFPQWELVKLFPLQVHGHVKVKNYLTAI